MDRKGQTIRLTAEQQKQIKDATGKNITELNIDLSAAGNLTVNELDSVSGGCADGHHDPASPSQQ